MPLQTERGNRSEPRWVWAACWLLILFLFASRIVLLFHRLYDPDEFEHLHAGVSVAQGQIPYRDFFEHHGPLTYTIAGGIAQWTGANLTLFSALRAVSLAFSVATLAGVYCVASRMYGKGAGLIGILFLESWPWFQEKSLEYRPDVLATCFLIWAVWFAVANATSIWRRGVPIGLCLGLASLCTLKIVFLVLGIAAGAVFTQWSRSAKWKGQMAATAFAGVIPIAAYSVYFWQKNALMIFWEHVFWLPIVWTEREPFHEFCFALQQWSPIHLGLGAAAIAYSICKLSCRIVSRTKGECVLTLAVVLHFAAIPWLKAVFLQYYLLGLPFVAVLAAGMVCRLSLRRTVARKRGLRSARMDWVLLLCLTSMIVGMAVNEKTTELCLKTLRLCYESGSMQPFQSLPRVRLYFGVDTISLLLALFAATIAMLLTPFSQVGLIGIKRRVMLGILWIALAVPTLNRLILPHFEWRNDGQREDLALIDKLVQPGEKVLDGFSGLGALRPHALYWWWLNPHSIPLMYQREGHAYIQQALAIEPPAMIIFDGYLDNYLRNHFAEQVVRKYQIVDQKLRSSNAILYIRNDLQHRTKTKDFSSPDGK